jgi:hypothetical protein
VTIWRLGDSSSPPSCQTGTRQFRTCPTMASAEKRLLCPSSKLQPPLRSRRRPSSAAFVEERERRRRSRIRREAGLRACAPAPRRTQRLGRLSGDARSSCAAGCYARCGPTTASCDERWRERSAFYDPWRITRPGIRCRSRLSSLLAPAIPLHFRMSVEAVVDWRDREVFGRGGSRRCALATLTVKPEAGVEEPTPSSRDGAGDDHRSRPFAPVA